MYGKLCTPYIQKSDLQHFNANYENYHNINIGEHNLRTEHAPFVNIWLRPLKPMFRLFSMLEKSIGMSSTSRMCRLRQLRLKLLLAFQLLLWSVKDHFKFVTLCKVFNFIPWTSSQWIVIYFCICQVLFNELQFVFYIRKFSQNNSVLRKWDLFSSPPKRQ